MPVQRAGAALVTALVAMSPVKMQFLRAEVLIITPLCRILFSTFDYSVFNLTLVYILKCIFIQKSV